jgi:hypothetical protein
VTIRAAPRVTRPSRPPCPSTRCGRPRRRPR